VPRQPRGTSVRNDPPQVSVLLPRLTEPGLATCIFGETFAVGSIFMPSISKVGALAGDQPNRSRRGRRPRPRPPVIDSAQNWRGRPGPWSCSRSAVRPNFHQGGVPSPASTAPALRYIRAASNHQHIQRQERAGAHPWMIPMAGVRIGLAVAIHAG
jgi:hypothetical protein